MIFCFSRHLLSRLSVNLKDGDFLDKIGGFVEQKVDFSIMRILAVTLSAIDERGM